MDILLLIQNYISIQKPGKYILSFNNYNDSLKGQIRAISYIEALTINPSLTLCYALLVVFTSQPTQPSPLEGIDATVAPPPASLLPPGGG